MTRPYVSTSVQVEIVDEPDRTPYWLLSTRHPAALAGAIDSMVPGADERRSPDRSRARYGTTAPAHRHALRAAVVTLAVIGGSWLIWATTAEAHLEARSELISFDIVDAHHTSVVVDVALVEDAVGASCLLRAFADDHVTVGELAFVPRDGLNEPTIRTDRLSTAVELVGCATEQQPRPR